VNRYRTPRPNSIRVEKLNDEIEIEISYVTDDDNTYFCTECEEVIVGEFRVIGNAILCSSECETKYLERWREQLEAAEESEKPEEARRDDEE